MLRYFVPVGFIVMAVLAAVLIISSSQAANRTVTLTADSGPGTLRGEIAAANPGDTVTFAPALSGQTITLTSDQIDINKDLSINGPAGGITVSGNDAYRVFVIEGPNTASMSNLTLTRGSSIGAGGALSVNGTLSLNRVTVSHSHADRNGGGVYVSGVLNATRSTFSFNDAGNPGDPTMGRGAAIYADGGYPLGAGSAVTIDHSAITNNHANYLGGGVYAEQGLFASGGAVHISNSTLSGNFAEEGAAVYSDVTSCPICGAPHLDLSYSTVTANFAGAGSALDFADLTASIIARQTSGPNCFSAASHGYNLDDDNSCSLNKPGDHPAGSVTLGPLQVNPPGSTATHALLGGDALQAIPPGQAGCGSVVNTDQRGVFRPSGTGCEIGAYEVGSSLACFELTPTPFATSTPIDQTPSPAPTGTASPRPTRSPGAPSVTPIRTPCATLFGGAGGTPAPTPASLTPTPVPPSVTPTATPRPTRTPRH